MVQYLTQWCFKYKSYHVPEWGTEGLWLQGDPDGGTHLKAALPNIKSWSSQVWSLEAFWKLNVLWLRKGPQFSQKIYTSMSCFEVGKGKRADSLFSDQVSVKRICSNQVLKGSHSPAQHCALHRRRGSSSRAPAAPRQSGFHGNCPALCLCHPVWKYSFISLQYRYIILVQIKINDWSREAVKPRIIYLKMVIGFETVAPFGCVHISSLRLSVANARMYLLGQALPTSI